MKSLPTLQIQLPLMVLIALGLLSALWAALVRAGWDLPVLPVPIVSQHGSLMVSGFIGALICLERAVALKGRWGYLPPGLVLIGTLLLLSDLPSMIGRGLIALGALGLLIIFLNLMRKQPNIYLAIMGLGALVWLIGSILWLANWPVYRVVPWWAGFLILTIFGERLELSRLAPVSPGGRILFRAVIAILLAGLVITAFPGGPVYLDWGLRVAGLGLLGLGVWLLNYDIARRTIRQTGVTRYIAACLIPGYFWLSISGVFWLIFAGQYTQGLIYDAMLHGIFLGFTMSMIFGHALIIGPALLHIRLNYSPAFYLPLSLLHTSLFLRVAGDLAGSDAMRMWMSLMNVLSVLLFLIVMANSARQARLYNTSPLGSAKRAP